MAKADLAGFNPHEVGRLDAQMWRAYYNHQFFKMFKLLLRTMRSQLHLNWWLTLRLAYYAGWAATDYRIKKSHENFPRVLKNLTKFYKVISDHCKQPFDYKGAAKLCFYQTTRAISRPTRQTTRKFPSFASSLGQVCTR